MSVCLDTRWFGIGWSRQAGNLLLREFLRHFQIDSNSPGVLQSTAEAFARLPYENLTKIIQEAECGPNARARRGPEEVLIQHFAFGTGGTCFSLTSALLYLVRALGYAAEPILADRPYGPDTHCALLVWIEDHPHLLDPGYLIVNPVPISAGGESRLRASFNEMVLVPAPGGDRMDLCTTEQGKRACRISYKLRPVDASEFLKVWDESFKWEMMRYPLLTRTEGSRQLYLRGNRLQIRSNDSVERLEVSPDALIARIAAEFGIAPAVAAKALSILKQRGERLG